MEYRLAGRIPRIVLVVAILFAITPSLQSDASTRRPRVGLALGGGGARGFAHIGVIEWIEEHQIPVDYIAGTSMGGLVGAFYAMGKSPAEMRDLIGRMDWEKLFAKQPYYSDLSYRRKEDRLDYQTPIDLGWNNGPTLSDGLISGHFIGLLFDRQTVSYSDISSFDELPIPFRCVAVDLVIGETVVLGKGSLADALKATMAIPGVFKPVEIDGRLLVDGGVLQNLPVEVVKSMGAEIVIAVDVGTPLSSRDQLKSVFDVLDQTAGIMMQEQIQRSRELADILLIPDLGSHTTFSFAASDEIMRMGKATAEARQVDLQKFSVPLAEWAQYAQARDARRRTETPVPSGITLQGVAPRSERRILRGLERYVGNPLELDPLEDDLSRLYGQGQYARVGYHMGRGEAKDQLQIAFDAKNNGPPFFSLGISLNNTKVEPVAFNFKSRMTAHNVTTFGSEWRIDATVGSDLFAGTELYQPVGWGFFLAPRAFAGRQIESLYFESEPAAEYSVGDYGFGLDLGWGAGLRQTELRFGFAVARQSANLRIGDPLLPSIEGTTSEVSLRWVFDTRDYAVLAMRGTRVEFESSWFLKAAGSSGEFPQSILSVTHQMPVTRAASVRLAAKAGTSFGETSAPLQAFVLGGPFQLGGYGYHEFRGSKLLYGSPGFLYEFGRFDSILVERLIGVGLYEVGSVFEETGDRVYRHGATAGISCETLMGPVFLGFGWGEGGNQKLYFSVGQAF